MPDEKSEIREINYKQLFPWTQLFRGFRIALDLKKLLLAAAGLLLMVAGWSVLTWPFLRDSDDVAAAVEQTAAEESASRAAEQEAALRDTVASFRRWPWDRPLRYGARRVLDEPAVLRDQPLSTLWRWASNWGLVLQPVAFLMRPFQVLFDSGRSWSWGLLVCSLLCGVWAVLVWAFFGGAITRLAAVQVARDEKIGLREALKFSWKKFPSFAGAPLFPFVAVIFILVFCTVGGLIVRVPWLGDLFAGLLWVLPLLAGGIMALLLVGLAVGWPLMFSTISAEGSDSFDALSRAYSYVYQRPWHYLFYAVVALLYGSLVTFFVVFFAQLVVYLSGWAVSWGASGSSMAQLFSHAPEVSGWQLLFGPSAELSAGRQVGAFLIAIWLHGIFLLMAGFVYSYFWTASTIMYFLLRHEVDATDMDEVYLEEEEEEEEFGVPAMEGEEAPEAAVESPTLPAGAGSETASPAGEEASPGSEESGLAGEAPEEKDKSGEEK